MQSLHHRLFERRVRDRRGRHSTLMRERSLAFFYFNRAGPDVYKYAYICIV